LFREGAGRDPRRALEGAFLGGLASVALFTGFGLLLAADHARQIADTARLFLCHGMTPVILPDDPCLRETRSLLGSALLLGIPLGSVASLAAAAAALIFWVRGAVGRGTAAAGAALVAAVDLGLCFTPEKPVASALCALLAPLAFFLPWHSSVRRGGPARRNRLRVFLFFALAATPMAVLGVPDPGRVRDALLDSAAGRRLAGFYYDHTLLAAHVIQAPSQRTQAAISVPLAMRIRGPLPHGTLWIRQEDPCALPGRASALSLQPLPCPTHVVGSDGEPVDGMRALAGASRRFDGNRRLLRTAGWFFYVLLPLLPLPAALWLALFLEDLYPARPRTALALLGLCLLLQGLIVGAAWRARAGGLPSGRLEDALGSPSPDLRHEALRQFPERIPDRALVVLAADPRPRIRLQALRALGHRRGSAPFRALRLGLDDPEPIVRTQACRGLGEQGGEEARRLLDGVLRNDPSWYVRNAAYRARGKSHPEARIVRGPCGVTGGSGRRGRGAGEQDLTAAGPDPATAGSSRRYTPARSAPSRPCGSASGARAAAQRSRRPCPGTSAAARR